MNDQSPSTEKSKIAKKIPAEDLAYIANCEAALLHKTTPYASALLYILAAFLVISVVWAHFSIIDEVTAGNGKVIPPSQVKIIQNLDGGIVSEIKVSEGQLVRKEQILLRIDDTRYVASFREQQAKYLALLATVTRLTAEINNQAQVNFSPELDSSPELRQHESKLFHARRTALENAIKVSRQSYEYAKKELDLTEPLVKQGVMSQIELLRIQRQVSELKGDIADKENKYFTETNTELAKVKAELATVKESLSTQHDRVVKAIVRSPVNGTIKKINFNTIGGVIQPGMEIMEIVPAEDFLIIETKIKPENIGFIKIGQSAKVKFTAYDFSIYGGLDGKVIYISPDTITDENDKRMMYYKVEVKTTTNHLGTDTNPLLIKVGMATNVDIITGRKSVLSYLLKPFLKAKQNALTER